MERYREPEKWLEVYGGRTYDVIVVGGGVAGWSAALAAARNGADTLIIERFPYFGGTATASLMGNINGFRNQVEPDGLQTTKGIGEELILRLFEENGIGETPYPHKKHSDQKGDLSYCYAVDTEILKYVLLRMLVQAGAHILFHTWFSDVILEEGRARGVIIENKSGRLAVYGKVVVDASGDGDAAVRAGADYWLTKSVKERPRMVDGLMYKVAGFPADVKFKGCRTNGTAILWGRRPDGNAADAEDLTREEIEVRLSVFEDFEEQKKKQPLYANAHIVDTGSLIGIRQSRFIIGDYTLTVDDVLAGRRFEDGVAMASSPIVEHPEGRKYLTHTGYEIPYRCLLPQKVEGLLVAGRAMSSDQLAYESWRAMAHILAIGEAAGTAAALSARANVTPRALDRRLLRETLIRQGAEIGQGRG